MVRDPDEPTLVHDGEVAIPWCFSANRARCSVDSGSATHPARGDRRAGTLSKYPAARRIASYSVNTPIGDPSSPTTATRSPLALRSCNSRLSRGRSGGAVGIGTTAAARSPPAAWPRMAASWDGRPRRPAPRPAGGGRGDDASARRRRRSRRPLGEQRIGVITSAAVRTGTPCGGGRPEVNCNTRAVLPGTLGGLRPGRAVWHSEQRFGRNRCAVLHRTRWGTWHPVVLTAGEAIVAVHRDPPGDRSRAGSRMSTRPPHRAPDRARAEGPEVHRPGACAAPDRRGARPGEDPAPERGRSQRRVRGPGHAGAGDGYADGPDLSRWLRRSVYLDAAERLVLRYSPPCGRCARCWRDRPRFSSPPTCCLAHRGRHFPGSHRPVSFPAQRWAHPGLALMTSTTCAQ